MTSGKTPGYRRAVLACPQPFIMVYYFDFFGHFWLIFRDFSRFQVLFMCVDLFKSYRNTGEHWGGGLACPTIHNSMLFRFFGHFLLTFLFAFSHVFHALRCTWRP